MNKLILLITTLLLNSIVTTAQNVNIPDANFKAYLVGNTSINTNGDGEIQVSEATAFTGTISCGTLGISNLTGIEAFTGITQLDCFNNQLTSLSTTNNINLTVLNCYNNQLTSLDVSTNTALVTLGCNTNQLTSVDVSNNIALKEFYPAFNQISSLNISTNIALIDFDCGFNQLTTLDMSNNTALKYVACYNNSLVNLDLSANSSLIRLDCTNNQLNSLNVANGNNTNFIGFYTANNPNLSCIQVDSVAYSTANWTAIDTIVYFSTNCFTNITTLTNQLQNITTYPNPTSGNLNINLGKTFQNVFVEVHNTLGQQVLVQDFNATTQVELVLEGTSGVYFIHIRTEEGEAIAKVVKE